MLCLTNCVIVFKELRYYEKLTVLLCFNKRTELLCLTNCVIVFNKRNVLLCLTKCGIVFNELSYCVSVLLSLTNELKKAYMTKYDIVNLETNKQT